jgi:hypothetical protein
MNFRAWLLIFFMFFIGINAFSQTSEYKAMCFEYHNHSCNYSENIYYKYNDASRSALFLKGQTSETRLEITNGRDYRISLCADEVLGNQIFFRLIGAREGKVLYDSRNDDYSWDFEFTVTQSTEIIIEVTVEGTSLGEGEHGTGGIVRRDNAMGCVGVLVEYMITPKKGF